MIKKFVEGTQLIKKYNGNETFLLIKINKNVSQINFFENSSFRFKENFSFGSKIILNDISKVCSLDHKTIENILLDDNFGGQRTVNNEELLDKKYFINRSIEK